MRVNQFKSLISFLRYKLILDKEKNFLSILKKHYSRCELFVGIQKFEINFEFSVDSIENLEGEKKYFRILVHLNKNLSFIVQCFPVYIKSKPFYYTVWNFDFVRVVNDFLKNVNIRVNKFDKEYSSYSYRMLAGNVDRQTINFFNEKNGNLDFYIEFPNSSNN